MIQKITQNNWNFWTVNFIMGAKIVNRSSDFPVRRTGSYRHKKALEVPQLSMQLDRAVNAHGTYAYVPFWTHLDFLKSKFNYVIFVHLQHNCKFGEIPLNGI